MRYIIILTICLASLLDCLAEPPGTNSSALTPAQLSVYRTRAQKLFTDYNADSTTNAQDRLFENGRDLQRDYPNGVNGWQDMMCAIEDCPTNNASKARDWAKELMDSSAPERYKLWAKGFLHRLDSQGKQVVMKFTSVDGREVDLAQMRGKVVLVDFWSTGCVPCVAELPRVKAAFEKYHQNGFEVVGISCDTDKDSLERFLKEKRFTWPQYFDGQQQERNKIAQGFGIDAIPHMFFVDKKGCLRFDNVRAVGAKADFEGKIESLLSEQ